MTSARHSLMSHLGHTTRMPFLLTVAFPRTCMHLHSRDVRTEKRTGNHRPYRVRVRYIKETSNRHLFLFCQIKKVVAKLCEDADPLLCPEDIFFLDGHPVVMSNRADWGSRIRPLFYKISFVKTSFCNS